MQFVGVSSITVKWEPVPQGSQNGKLKGYQVRYRQTFSNGSDGKVKTQFWSSPATNVTLTNLAKASVYKIEVAGKTLVGIGNYSEPVTAKTCKFQTALII